MDVIRLQNGNLLVPESATGGGDRFVGDAYVEIGPSDPDYARLAGIAISEEDVDARSRRWREGDEALRRQFLEFLARGGK